MSDRSFQQAVQMVDDALGRAPDVATRLLFDRYRNASPDYRDAIVLALIGRAVATAARKRAPQATEAA